MLVGRETECARIDRLLTDAAAGVSGALVLSGEPGIGKSALCGWALARCGGARVLSARAVQSEVSLPFAGLAELCAGALDCVDSLPEPQAHALEAALARRIARPGDRFAIGAAVLSLLGSAAETGSVLAVVDDAQWLDLSSAHALLFAARRLRREGVAMLVATRPGAIFDDAHSGLPQVTLRGLAGRAAHQLLEVAHGPLPPQVADVLADRSGGNPLALLEMPRLLSPAQLAGEQPLDEPLPVGPTLERALLQRLSGMPDRTREALLLAAVSGGEHIQPVLDAMGALGLGPRVLEEAERRGVLAVTGERFEFRHPLLRAAIYHASSGPARRAAHAALARITSGETRAWHLAWATVGEDEAVAAMLEDVGLSARRRGASATATSALERAARLSPAGPARVRRLQGAAHDAYLSGRSALTLGLLNEALGADPDPLARADLERERCRIWVLQGEVDTAFGHLCAEAERLREVDPCRAAALLTDAALCCIPNAEVRTAITVARDACEVAHRADSSVQAVATSILASALALNGQRGQAATLAERCMPALRLADPLGDASELVANAAQSCNWLERYDLAAELLERLITSARAASTPTRLPYPLAFSAELNFRIGNWAVAAADAQEAVQLGEQMHQDASAGLGLGCLIRLAAATGHEQRCRAMVARSQTLIESHGMRLGQLYLEPALGLLELGLGHTESAIRHLRSAEAFAELHGVNEPNAFHWRADLVEAYVRAGNLEAAEAALVALEGLAHSTGGRWALGTAARCRGLLSDDAQAVSWFDSACAHLAPLPAPFEMARTYLCHGERLRRAGLRTDARLPLRRAIEGFDRLGATPWSHRARAELRATGVTLRRRVDASDRERLTAHEMQVALTVAGGASNREAAAALFLSPKTIEFHLGRIYRKLGVRTRTELAALAAARGWLHEGAVPSDSSGEAGIAHGAAGVSTSRR